MITGPDGFALDFGNGLFDDDTLTEYFSTISAIRGISYTEDDGLEFSFSIGRDSCTLMRFSDSGCTIPTSRIEQFLRSHGRSEAEAGQLFADLHVDNGEIPVPQYPCDFDETIIAIYRFITAIK